MSGSIIINQIKDKMSTLNIDDKSVVVLKGIPVSAVDPEVDKIVLSDVDGLLYVYLRQKKVLVIRRISLNIRFCYRTI